MASVVAVCISERKGTQKHEVPEIQLKIDHGIVGDAHGGNWHRQVSLLAQESVEKMKSVFPDIPVGAFAENILTEGLTLYTLPVGTRLRVGGSSAGGDPDREGMPCPLRHPPAGGRLRHASGGNFHHRAGRGNHTRRRCHHRIALRKLP